MSLNFDRLVEEKLKYEAGNSIGLNLNEDE